MMNPNGEPDSFFNVFSFTSLMHDGADQCIIYLDVTITKTVEDESGLRLKEGTTYEQVVFNFEKGLFSFENLRWPNDVGVITVNENNSVDILQSELAPFLKW